MPNAWIEVLLPVGLVAVIAVVSLFGPFGRRFRQTQPRHLVCPNRGEEVDCRIEQEIYTGRWEKVVSCSAFPGAAEVPCDKACVRQMNLGLPLAPPAT